MADEESKATADEGKPASLQGLEGDVLVELESELEANDPNMRAQFAEVIAEYAKRDWSKLEAAEHADHLLFADRVMRRRAGGAFEAVDVMIRVPRQKEMRLARAEARRLLEKDGLNPKDDKDLFDNLENIVILSKAIRNRTPPYEPWEPDPEKLERQYDTKSLEAVWRRLDAYNKLLDPRPETIGKPEFVALVGAVAEARSVLPLVATAGSAQNTFVVTMAVLLHGFLSRSSSSPSSGTSTPEPSPSKSSGSAPGSTAPLPPPTSSSSSSAP